MPTQGTQLERSKPQLKITKGMTFNPTDVHDIDFGVVDDQAEYGGQRIGVKMCGRYIPNTLSKAMSRGG